MPTRLPAILDKLKHVPFADQLNTPAKPEQAAGFSQPDGNLGALFHHRLGGKISHPDHRTGVDHLFHPGGRPRLSLVPSSRRKQRVRLDRTLRTAEVRMGKWLLGQGSLMVILGVLSTIVYLALGVRYAYALGVLTGALNIVPVLGAALSIALALLVAAIDSWGRALGVAVFYVIYLQVESSFLTPRIMKNRVGLPGLAIFVALLLGAALEGVIGAMVSIPTAVLVAILVDEYLVNKEKRRKSFRGQAWLKCLR